jgi:hypothetical protein
MAQSLFQRKVAPDHEPPTPYDLIEPEIVHLKKGYSVRYGPKPRKKAPLWVVVLGFGGLAWLYLMDPLEHAWYKEEAVKAYHYLHSYGAGKKADELAASGILSPVEVARLNQQSGSYQDSYATPRDAANEAATIVTYMNSVRLLHAGRYEQLDPLGRMRYLLFIRTGLFLPTSWDFLDPAVGP